MRASRIAVGLEPPLHVALRLRVDIVAEVDVHAFRCVLLVELPGNRGEHLRLSAAVVAHENDVLEAGDDRLLGDLGEHLTENLGAQADRAWQIRAGVVG